MEAVPSPPSKPNQNPFFLAAGDIQKKGSLTTNNKRAAGLSPPSIVSGASGWERSKSGDGAGGPSFNNRVDKENVEVGDAVIEKKYCKNSLGIFHIDSSFRKKIMWLVTTKGFDNVIITLISANCIFLMMGSPLDLDPNSTRNRILSAAEEVFLVLFTIEFVLKVIAVGFFWDKNSYLRSGWNWLDFVVVVIGFLSYIPGIENLSALRTFRVLRPLRTLTTVPGMRVIVVSLISSLPAMTGVALLCAFVFLLWGIIGIQLWAGVMHGRCSYNGVVDMDAFCAIPCLASQKAHECTPKFGRTCEAKIFVNQTVQGVCKAAENPYYGNLGFDNIGAAVMTLWTSMTLEGWVDVMYAIVDTWGTTWYAAIFVYFYFVSFILFGSFFVMNLFMAVVWDEYCEAEQAQEEREARERELLGLDDTVPDFAKEEKVADDLGVCKEQKQTDLEAQEENDNEFFQAAKDISPRKRSNSNSSDQGDQEVDEMGNKIIPPWSDHWLPQMCYTLVSTKVFNNFITLLIVFNTVCLSLESYSMSQGLIDFLQVMNHIFTWSFVAEMLLKQIGLGIKGYASDYFNIFDFVIVMFSLVEVVLFAVGMEAAGGVSALRAFRLLRVFKLARSWTELQHLLNTILQSVMDVGNASFLLFVIMIIFSLMGMQLFGGMLTADKFEGEQPMAHFDSFWWSFVTVFQVLTGENWNDVVYNCMHGAGWPISVVYFTLLNLVGTYLILNLFLAILLANFEEDNQDKAIATDKAVHSEGNGTNKVAPSPMAVIPAPPTGPDAAAGPAQNRSKANQVVRMVSDNNQQQSAHLFADGNQGQVNRQSLPEATGNSFFIFSPENPLRQNAFALIRQKWFDNFILFLIGVSSLALAIEQPEVGICRDLPSGTVNADGISSCYELGVALYWLDIVLNILFSIEMAAKMLALGAVLNKGAYWRDGWNIMDGFIVIISWVAIAFSGESKLKALRSFRALRALKPLRVVRRYPGLKLVVNSIFRSLPAIANVVLVCLLFFLIFGIIGVQNWMGGMHVCNDETINIMSECKGVFQLQGDDCGMLPTSSAEDLCRHSVNGSSFPRVWANKAEWGFDNVGTAMLTIFEVTSGEMWPDIMYDTVAITGRDKPMVRDYDQVFPAIYFIMVTIVIAFLMLNVFTGVVIDNYNEMKDEQHGSGLLSEEQKLWVEQMKLAMTTKSVRRVKKPKQSWRHAFFTISVRKEFEVFIMGCILINTCLMATRKFPQSDSHTDILETLNLVFNIIYTVEAGIKITGIGPKIYFTDGWCRFDFTLVVFAWIGGLFDLGQMATLLRVFRVARIFRLVKTSESLLNCFKTLVTSLPSLVNVFLVLLLIYFIFALIGMNLFSYVKPGDFITDHNNFNSFGASMLLLFRASTGESFNGIMHDCMIQAPYCVEGVNCGSPYIAGFYFLFFFTLQAYCMLELCTAIILDNFSDTVALAEANVNNTHIDSFTEAWSHHDYNGDNWIEADKITEVLLDTHYPLGLKNTPGIAHRSVLRSHCKQLLKTLKIPTRGGQINFQETLQVLMHRTNAEKSVQLPPREGMELHKKLKLARTKSLRKKGREKLNADPDFLKRHQAALIITSFFQGIVARKKSVFWNNLMKRAKEKAAKAAEENQP